jgi:serine/threonine-protein kinase HipA
METGNIPILVIRLHGQRIGCLFEFRQTNSEPIIRFVADDAHAAKAWGATPTLSQSMRANDPDQQRVFWLDFTRPEFNTVKVGGSSKLDHQLPAFFQNLLPEGMFRDHVAQDAKIDPTDHIRMLAACGKNLPGAVTAVWEETTQDDLTRIVVHQDAKEFSIWSERDQNALSLSGVQPKLGVNKDEHGRFVGRTTLGDAAIIAKLPSANHVRMPQVEDLAMRLAKLAGIDVCEFQLEPLSALQAPHRYDLASESQGHFLAVTRFDRTPNGRIHFEDFAQVFSVAPSQKYQQSYLDVADVLLHLPKAGVPAVHELLRRIEVNDLLGNADMHLKNLGLLYADPCEPRFAPAYDITSTVLYGARGHALQFLPSEKKGESSPVLTPKRVQDFCNLLGLPVKAAQAVVSEVVKLAVAKWLEPIQSSGLTDNQKALLVAHIGSHVHVQQLTRRRTLRPD